MKQSFIIYFSLIRSEKMKPQRTQKTKRKVDRDVPIAIPPHRAGTARSTFLRGHLHRRSQTAVTTSHKVEAAPPPLNHPRQAAGTPLLLFPSNPTPRQTTPPPSFSGGHRPRRYNLTQPSSLPQGLSPPCLRRPPVQPSSLSSSPPTRASNKTTIPACHPHGRNRFLCSRQRDSRDRTCCKSRPRPRRPGVAS